MTHFCENTVTLPWKDTNANEEKQIRKINTTDETKRTNFIIYTKSINEPGFVRIQYRFTEVGG